MNDKAWRPTEKTWKILEGRSDQKTIFTEYVSPSFNINDTIEYRIKGESQMESFNTRADNYKGEYFGPGITLRGFMNPLDCRYNEVKE